MHKELELVDIEIDKVKTEINDTSIGLTMLGVFFIALIPLFYSIIGIYRFTLDDIQIPLLLSVTIMLMATIMTVLHWETNKKKLKKLYDHKATLIHAAHTIAEHEAEEVKIKQRSVSKKSKK
jgi:uncharacterized membrane protein